MSLNKSKIRPVQREVASEETQMKALLNAPAGVVGLLSYLEGAMQNAEEAFRQAAVAAVYNPDVRMDAVQKQGVYDGLKQVHTRIEELRSTGA